MANHRKTIEDYLDGQYVQNTDLWCAVGYFWHGAGVREDQSFATDEQWHMLLLATNRREDARNLRRSLRE